MTFAEFWESGSLLPRAALICALIGASAHGASFLGLRMSGPLEALALVHVAIVVLGFVLFARIIRHHSLTWRGSALGASVPAPPVWLILISVLSLVYFVVLFLAAFASQGEGGAEVRDGQEVLVVRDTVMRILAPGSVARFEALTLRIFSAAWIAFGLLIAIGGYYVETRIQAPGATAD